jgi:hypothetical protein
MRATWTCLVGLEHDGVVSGGEQASEVRGAGPFPVVEFVRWI